MQTMDKAEEMVPLIRAFLARNVKGSQPRQLHKKRRGAEPCPTVGVF
jgi:hypothetical protein